MPNIADLDALAPKDVAVYLAGSGWLERQRAQHASIWTVGDGNDELELLLPLNPEFRDYRARLRDAVQMVALAEERDVRDVLADIMSATVDTQHFHLLPNLPSGTISLIDIVDVTRGVRDLMFTAAHAATVDVPMLVQLRPRPQEANRFVRGVRLAAPKPGSFILSAQVPLTTGPGSAIPSQQTPVDLPLSQQPFNRRVVLKLHEAISAAHRAADEAAHQDSLVPFTDRAEAGISANLCEAIGLIGKSQPFDLRFAWAQSMPVTQVTPRFSFDRRRISAVQAAAKELPRLAAEAEIVLIGRVIRLDRVGQGTGKATLRGSVQDTAGDMSDVSVTATLPSHLYDTAVVAHREHRKIRVVGRLRGNDLYWIRSIEVLGNLS